MFLIKVNGEIVPGSIAVVDTFNNTATLQTLFNSEIKLNMEKNQVEVNIFGDIEL